MAHTNPFFQGTLQEAVRHSLELDVHFATLIVDGVGEAAPLDEELAKALKATTVLYSIPSNCEEAINLYAFLPRRERLPCLVIVERDGGEVESIGLSAGEKTLEEVKQWLAWVVGPAGESKRKTAPASTTSPAPIVQGSAEPPPPTTTPTNPAIVSTIASTTTPTVSPLAPNAHDPPGSENRECELNFRLLNGTVFNQKFPSEVKLGVEVRQWIDQNRPDKPNCLYTFTQLLFPSPNRDISFSEEHDGLKDIGLTPSATLILSPITGSNSPVI
ncbi:hypothetical protein EV426DRAFT_3444 [Tirmania nivea]|nr:hypothetical protein EV426DRAFT_3444 [Tirmania nivea]